MPGLRVTFDRRWPVIFEKHPWPWRMDTGTAEGPTVIDAVGDVVVEGDLHLTYWLYDLYTYTMRPLCDYGIGFNPSYWMPAVLYNHPLPWRYQRRVYYRSGRTAEETHTVVDAFSVRVFACMVDDPDWLAFAALYDLANFVECRIRTREVAAAQ